MGSARARRSPRRQPLGRIQARRRWFADHAIGGLGTPGDIVWDAYLAFGRSSRWHVAPGDLLASGSDIIDNTAGLEERFVPLLRGD